MDGTFLTDSDRADGLGRARKHLAGPLTGGLELEDVAIAGASEEAQGKVGDVLDACGLHLVLVGDLGETAISVTATVSGQGRTIVRTVVFEPWSEAGTALAALFPADGRLDPPIKVSIKGPSGIRISDRVRLRVVRGVFAHLVYLGQIEAARLRRTIRMLARVRLLAGASGPLLDRHGADLAVPRLQDRITFANGAMQVEPYREDDQSYRRRLKHYREMAMPTTKTLMAAMVESGLVAADGKPAVGILERDNPFETAILLVSTAATKAQATTQRTDFLARIRDNILIDPGAAALPPRVRDTASAEHETALHADLRAILGNPAASTPLAPTLAEALLRLCAVAKALGLAAPVTVLQGQRDDGGDRYELGLGAEVRFGPAAEAQLKAAIAAPPAGLDAAMTRMITEAADRVARGDTAIGALARASGFETVLLAAADTLYLSPLRLGGTEIQGSADRASGTLADFKLSDRIDPQGTRWRDALVAAAGAAAVPGAAIDGAAVKGAVQAGLADPAGGFADYLRGGTLTPSSTAALSTAIMAADPVGLVGFQLDDPSSADLKQGNAAALTRLSAMISELASKAVPGLVVAVLAAGPVLLITGPRGVPPLGANLTGRAAVQTRWYWVPLKGPQADRPARFAGVGPSPRSVDPPDGLYALIAVTYRREFGADPFEVRIEPRDGVRLDFGAYEELMNLLLRFRPAGIEFNTWFLRKGAVRFDPARPDEPPSVKHERSYRHYRLPRFAGWKPSDTTD
ncbi:hypothetical protein [Azospirillum sp.]|uniref:hypothetical protein n=1 Tax=Azospirillum sp. TaxID=34012 RepID=UPI002D29CAA8|nr:hypothetical protein [Azospirillum sp.]HYF90104.1 hypothetical protein [Azospirillum sp.]